MAGKYTLKLYQSIEAERSGRRADQIYMLRVRYGGTLWWADACLPGENPDGALDSYGGRPSQQDALDFARDSLLERHSLRHFVLTPDEQPPRPGR